MSTLIEIADFSLPFFYTLPVCAVMLWGWLRFLREDHIPWREWPKALALFAGCTGAAMLLQFVRLLPAYRAAPGMYFSYYNHFNTALIAYILLTGSRPWSPRLLPRALAFLAVNPVLAGTLSQLRSAIGGVPSSILIMVLQCLYVLAFVVWMDGFHPAENLMTWAILTLVMDLDANLFRLMLNLAGLDDMATNRLFPSLPLYANMMVHLLFSILVFRLTAAFLQKTSSRYSSVSLKKAILIGSVVMVLSGPVYAVVRNYQAQSLEVSMCCKFLCVIIYLLLLWVRTAVIRRDTLDTELEITRELLHRERKHYEEMRDNIDMVNMRCHDINRQLRRLQDHMTTEELAALREAVQIYDSNIRTGSEICDMLLSQKQLLCEQHQIRMTYLVDGGKTGFIRNDELYAMLENLLGNAMDAVLKLRNPEKRIISLSVTAPQDTLLIEVNNYCDPAALPQEGRLTAKEDAVHHGYGIKSVRYIASCYRGRVEISRMEDIFTVFVTIPLPEH